MSKMKPLADYLHNNPVDAVLVAEVLTCMRKTIKEIFYAAELLGRAVDAHLNQDRKVAEQLFRSADLPEVRAWTESLWGANRKIRNNGVIIVGERFKI